MRKKTGFSHGRVIFRFYSHGRVIFRVYSHGRVIFSGLFPREGHIFPAGKTNEINWGKGLGKGIILSSVLYSRYFHPLRTTFPPFPRPLWVAPAHPERTGAAMGSPKANATLAWSTPPSTRPERGTTAHPDLLPELLTKISTINYLEI